jgi:hypothetical protein
MNGRDLCVLLGLRLTLLHYATLLCKLRHTGMLRTWLLRDIVRHDVVQ